MEYAIVTTKIDPQTKKEAQKTAEALGMPLSVVVKAFLKQFVRTKSLTFSLRDEEPNDYLKNILQLAKEDYKKGNTSPRFKNAEDFIKFLHKKDD